MTLSDSEIFNDTKHRAASLRQLSFLPLMMLAHWRLLYVCLSNAQGTFIVWSDIYSYTLLTLSNGAIRELPAADVIRLVSHILGDLLTNPVYGIAISASPSPLTWSSTLQDTTATDTANNIKEEGLDDRNFDRVFRTTWSWLSTYWSWNCNLSNKCHATYTPMLTRRISRDQKTKPFCSMSWTGREFGDFYRASAYWRDFNIANMSVRPSVCPLRSGIRWKRLNISS